MATIIRLKDTINNPDAPYITVYDPIESRVGSLLLWDAGKSLFSTTPNIGDVFSNLLTAYPSAADNAVKLLKGDFDDGRHAQFVKRELSSKGGLHFAMSRVYAGDTYSTLNNRIVANATLQEKLRVALMGANPSIFISVWDRITRNAPAGSGAPTSSYISSTASVNDYAFYSRSDETVPRVAAGSVSTSHLLKTAIDSTTLNMPNKEVMNLKSVGGAGVLSNTVANIVLQGYFQPWAQSQAVNKVPSRIIYRVYIEDLNLSGRTYAEVKAIDDAEFAKAFAVGGRFYGDTWSDPATLLP